MSAKRNGASVSFIFVTILLDAIGIGLLIPILPDVLRRFSSEPAAVAAYYGYFVAAYAAMQFLASPTLGSLSDRFGRRPILLLSLVGSGLDYIFMAFAPNLPLLFLGRVISGLTGASMTVASSYMADISDDSNRSKNFGLIGAAWGIGFIAGPLLGGLLAKLGHAAPFLGAAALTLLNFVWGVFVLPESLDQAHRRQLSWRALNPLRSVLKVLKPSDIAMLIWIFFIIFLAGQVHPVNWTLYSQLKFGWSAWEVGLSLSFVGVMMALSQGLLTGFFIHRMGEQNAFTFGLIIYIIGFLGFALCPAGWMMYPCMVVFSLSGVAIPALQSIVSKRIPVNEQGELQGSLVALGSLASMLSPLLYTELFVHFTKEGADPYFPGAAYLGATALCVLAFVLRILGIKSKHRVAKAAAP